MTAPTDPGGCVLCFDEGGAYGPCRACKRDATAPTETPSLTTEQAREPISAERASIHARLWVADEGDPDYTVLSSEEVECLKSWVRAKVENIAAEKAWAPGRKRDHIAARVSLALRLDVEQARALIEAALGWPS